MEESPEWQAQQQLWKNRGSHPANRSGRRLSGLTFAGAAQNPTHTAIRGITAVDARPTTYAEVRAATTAATT